MEAFSCHSVVFQRFYAMVCLGRVKKLVGHRTSKIKSDIFRSDYVIWSAAANNFAASCP